jgi:hypothetical protein
MGLATRHAILSLAQVRPGCGCRLPCFDSSERFDESDVARSALPAPQEARGSLPFEIFLSWE